MKNKNIGTLEEKVRNSKKDKDDDTCCCILLVAAALILAYSCGKEEGRGQTQGNYVIKKIEFYQQNVSPKLHELLKKDNICGFTPSCSEYAKQAVQKYGTKKGSAMAAKRLIKCNPFSKGGYDPVA